MGYVLSAAAQKEFSDAVYLSGTVVLNWFTSDTVKTKITNVAKEIVGNFQADLSYTTLSDFFNNIDSTFRQNFGAYQSTADTLWSGGVSSVATIAISINKGHVNNSSEPDPDYYNPGIVTLNPVIDTDGTSKIIKTKDVPVDEWPDDCFDIVVRANGVTIRILRSVTGMTVYVNSSSITTSNVNLGSGFVTTSTVSEQPIYISALYCLGYSPLKVTDFKLGDFLLTNNDKNLIQGCFSTARGTIDQHWNNNDITLELIQQNPNDSTLYRGDIYDDKVVDQEVDANIMFIADKQLADCATVAFKGSKYPNRFRTNTVMLSDSCPYKVTINLAFPDGVYATYNHTKDNITEQKFQSIPILFAAQWRVQKDGEKSSQADGSDYNDWNNIATNCTLDENLALRDICFHGGNDFSSYGVGVTGYFIPANEDSIKTFVSNYYDAVVYIASNLNDKKDLSSLGGNYGYVSKETAKKLYDEFDAKGYYNLIINGTEFTETGYLVFLVPATSSSGYRGLYGDWFGKQIYCFSPAINDSDPSTGIAACRLSFDIQLPKATCESLLASSCPTKSIEIRVIRISPGYINETVDHKISDTEYNSAFSYSDTMKWTSIVTYCFDEDTIKSSSTIPPKKAISDSDLRKFTYVALRAKVDAAGNIKNQLGKLNCIAQSFAPVWDNGNKKWLPENVTKQRKYFGYYKNGKPVDRSSSATETEVSKETYEKARNGTLDGADGVHLNWVAKKDGSNFTSKMKQIVFSGTPDNVGDYYLPDVAKSYVTSNVASNFLLAGIGAQCGEEAMGYENFNMMSLADWYMDSQGVTDGSTYSYAVTDSHGVHHKAGDPVSINFETNAYIYQGIKLETLMQKLAVAGRAVFTYDESGKIKIIFDKKVNYPVGIINQQNCISGSSIFSYEELPAGLRIPFADENDGYEQNQIYCWNDGNSLTNYKGKVESYNIDYVTNPYQIWSLGRYLLASRSLQKEVLTRKVGVDGNLYEIGDVVAVQGINVLIGESSGRIQEVIEDDANIYGVIINSAYTFLANGSQGIVISQPRLTGKNRVLNIELSGQTEITVGEVTYYFMKGETNLIIFKNPLKKRNTTDPSQRETDGEFDIRTGNICYVGDLEVNKELYRITKIKPEQDGTFTETLVIYKEELYTAGTKIPHFVPTTRRNARVDEDYMISNIPLSVADFQLATTGAIEQAKLDMQRYTTSRPQNPYGVTALCKKDTIDLSCAVKGDKLSDSVKLFEWHIKKHDGTEVTFQRADAETNYKFDRAVDGYLEKSDLDKWEIKVRILSVYDLYSDWVDCSSKIYELNYTWIPCVPTVNSPVAGKDGFSFNWTLPTENFGDKKFIVKIYDGDKLLHTSGVLTDTRYEYQFDRSIDGYPEKSALENVRGLDDYKIEVTHYNEAYPEGNKGTTTVDTSSYNTWIPGVLNIDSKPKVDENGFQINWKPVTSNYGQDVYKVKIYKDTQCLYTSSDLTRTYFDYKFDRAVDGYPEREDLEKYTVKVIRGNEVYSTDLNLAYSTKALDYDDYGTWKIASYSPDNVHVDVVDRTVILKFTKPVSSLTLYGDISYKVSVKRTGYVPAVDGDVYEDVSNAIIDSKYYKPNLNGDFLTDEDGYKIDGNVDYVVSSNTFTMSMPLLGQNKDKTKSYASRIVNTMYKFKVVPFTAQCDESTNAVEVSATALCTSLRDIVYARMDYQELYVKKLSAICANIGLIKEGGMGDLQYNYWALSDLLSFDTGLPDDMKAGEFRVGDGDSYIKVSYNDDGKAVVTLKASTFTVTARDTRFNKELIVIEDEDLSLDRTRITPTGTYYEHRKTPQSDFYIVNKVDTEGIITSAIHSDGQLSINNVSTEKQRELGHDIGRLLTPDHYSVWHLDGSETAIYDKPDDDPNWYRNLEEEVDAVNKKILNIFGDFSYKGAGDSTDTDDFVPAIISEAPYPANSKSVYGNHSIELFNPFKYTEFWLKYYYNESQRFFTGYKYSITDGVFSHQEVCYLQVKQDEPVMVRSGVASWKNDGDIYYTSDRNPSATAFVYYTKSEAEAGGTSTLTIDSVTKNDIGIVQSITIGDLICDYESGDVDFNFETFAPPALWNDSSVIMNRAKDNDIVFGYINGTKYGKYTYKEFSFKEDWEGKVFSNDVWRHIGLVSNGTNLTLYYDDDKVVFTDSLLEVNEVFFNESRSLVNIDEIYISKIDGSIDYDEEFYKNSINRIPFGNIDNSSNWFLFDADDPAKVKSNILDKVKSDLDYSIGQKTDTKIANTKIELEAKIKSEIKAKTDEIYIVLTSTVMFELGFGPQCEKVRLRSLIDAIVKKYGEGFHCLCCAYGYELIDIDRDPLSKPMDISVKVITNSTISGFFSKYFGDCCLNLVTDESSGNYKTVYYEQDVFFDEKGESYIDYRVVYC